MNPDTKYGPLVLWAGCCGLAGAIAYGAAGTEGGLLLCLGILLGLVR